MFKDHSMERGKILLTHTERYTVFPFRDL